jgi:hypothetical protein
MAGGVGPPLDLLLLRGRLCRPRLVSATRGEGASARPGPDHYDRGHAHHHRVRPRISLRGFRRHRLVCRAHTGAFGPGSCAGPRRRHFPTLRPGHARSVRRNDEPSLAGRHRDRRPIEVAGRLAHAPSMAPVRCLSNRRVAAACTYPIGRPTNSTSTCPSGCRSTSTTSGPARVVAPAAGRYHCRALRALSSGGERFLDAEEATGSNPVAPTTFTEESVRDSSSFADVPTR